MSSLWLLFPTSLLEPLFKEEEVEKERNVIFQEIDMRNGQSGALKTQENLRTLFWRPARRLGYRRKQKTVASIKREKIS